MSPTLRLAWRYLAYHRVRTALLVLCVALVFLLPLAVQLLVDSYSRALGARAAATPLVAGAPGSRYDLVLNALYFEGRVPGPTSLAEVEAEAFIGIPRAHAVRTICAKAFRSVRVAVTVGRRWFWGGWRLADVRADPWRP